MQSEIPIQRKNLNKLYQNIGQEAGLHQILKIFYKNLSQDVLVGFFFHNKNLDEIIEKQKEFLMRAMGARTTYTGKSPAQAHVQLAPILTGHFDRRLQVLKKTLEDQGVSEEDIATWVQFENTFRDSIVSTNP